MIMRMDLLSFITKSPVMLMLVAILLSAGVAEASISETGSRVWDGTKNMSNVTYTWNSHSFSGFYYNLDDNLTTEELTIKNIKWTIDEGDITYRTSPVEVSFEYPAFGKYQVIGFMAGKYFAGYTERSVISGNKRISTIGPGQLQRVLLDDEDERVVSTGGTLTLKENYVLRINEIDIGAGPGQIRISLLKDGVEVDTDVVAGKETYVYKKRIGSLNDLPIIAIHFDTVFRGREVDATFIDGIFQVSDTFTRVKRGDRYGSMEITGVGTDQVTMKNENTIDFSPGTTVNLMGDLNFIVADNSSVLRFALSAERIRPFEVRGTIYPVTREWTPLNFGLNVGSTSLGFYYDMDDGLGTESLKITSISETTIADNGLTYSTVPTEVGFDYSPFGKYEVIGFMAEKYFSGYTSKTVFSNEKSALSGKQLHQVLLDDDEKRTVSEGGSLALKDGYVLKITGVDIGAGPGQVLISLLKDGIEVDSDVVAGDDIYTYKKRIGAVNDLVILAINFDSVFRGREFSAVFTNGIFQISDTFITVNSGDSYGAMEISSVSVGGIKMSNDNSIDLSRGSEVDLLGNIKFKVADSKDLRFYPFIMVTSEMLTDQLSITVPSTATAGNSIKIQVMAGGRPVEGATISIEPEIGQLVNKTDRNGVLEYVLPRTLKGKYDITATKLGFQRASKSIGVFEYIENVLNIDAPVEANQFDTVTIRVKHNESPISGVTVKYDDVTIGQTNVSGALEYELEASGIHTISVSKTDYVSSSREIKVLIPFSEFKALDIKIIPDVVMRNENILIESNITNVGTKTDNLPVVLIINGSEVDKRSITLAPRETKKLDMTYKAVLPDGNYTVEILGQKGILQIKEKGIRKTPAISFLITGVVVIVGAIVIIYQQKGKKKREQKGLEK